MTDQPFQIPGLGQAKPNEQLPVQNFAPDLLAAAASIGGDGEITIGVASEQRSKDKNGEGIEAAQPNNSMDVDRNEASGQAGVANRDGNSSHEATQIPNGAPSQQHPKAEAANLTKNDVDMTNGANTPPSPGVTAALEAALDGMMGATGPGQGEANGNQQAYEQAQEPQEAPDEAQSGDAEQEAEHREWEVDSSPYQSSSESDSSDSSSEDESEDEGGYPLLGIEETARLLMEEDAEDGTNKGGKGGSAALRTKNELPDDVLPKPNVTITPEMKIEPLGTVQFIVENTAVIKSQTPGEVQVLERGSVLCKEDLTIIGALTDILGNVKSPVYIVRFATENEIQELGLQVGLQVFYSVPHAVYAFTQAIREIKGCDASNLHDEEIDADEMEFSDDEKEAEYKRQRKLKGRTGKGGRGRRETKTQPHAQGSQEPIPANGNLNYDEEEDGPYKPLSRPSGFAQGMSSAPSLPPKPETSFSQPRGGSGHGQRGSYRGGRGDFRGRNHRGGQRGGDRKLGGQNGGHAPFRHENSSSSATHSLPQPPAAGHNSRAQPPSYGSTPPIPPPVHSGQWPPVPAAFPPPPFPFTTPPAQGQAAPPHPPAAAFNFNYQAWAQAQGQQYPYSQVAARPPVPAPTPSYPPVASPTTYPTASVPPAWPGAVAQTTQPGTYANTGYYGGVQYQQHPAAQPAQPAQQAQQAQQQAQPPAPQYQRYQQQQQQPPYWN